MERSLGVADLSPFTACSFGWFVKKYCWLVCVREKYYFD